MDRQKRVQEQFPDAIVYEKDGFTVLEYNGPHALAHYALERLRAVGIYVAGTSMDSSGVTYHFADRYGA